MHSFRVLVLVALVATAATALEEDPQLPVEDEATLLQEVEEQPRMKVSGRTLKDWSDKFWKWMGYDEYDYDYDYDYYELSQGYPSVGYVPASAGGVHSTYTNYVPVQAQQQFGHPARDDDYGDEEWSFTDMMFDMAVTVVPIGLLLSALPAGLFTFAIRRRSFDDSQMLMDSLEPEEVNRIIALLKSDLTDRRCQEELFCELSRVGEHDGSSYLQQAFYYVSTLTPDFLAGRYGLDNLFRTTRSGYCQALQCPSTSLLQPPRINHQPTNSNHIDEIPTDGETEVVEVSKE